MSKTSRISKTNAVRELERLKIPLRLVEYDVDLDDLSAVHAASVSNIPIERIYKTLVLRADNSSTDLLVAVIPGGMELDLKKLASLAGRRRVELIHMKELFELTGYVRGGCSPIGMKQKYPTFIDISALNFKEISVSAGRRGLQMLCNPSDLIKASKAHVGEIVRGKIGG